MKTSTVENDSNVYILGAGFSRPAGLPLVSDFMFQMRDALEWHADKGNRQAVEAISKVLQFRLNATSSAYRVRVDLENIEDLFSLAAASAENLDEAMKVAIASTIGWATCKSHACTTGFRAKEGSSPSFPGQWQLSDPLNRAWKVPMYDFIAKTLLDRWGETSPSTKSTILSFNYDVLLEAALARTDIPFSYGVKSLDNSGSSSSGNAESHLLLKLHGSVNWAVPKHKRTEISSFSDPDELIADGLVPALLPPTWRKDSLTAFSAIWNQALDAISNATRIVVIGFSIPPTDFHFRYLLAAGLRSNISLREIVFVDPSSSLLKERSNSIFANQEINAARLRFEPVTVENFCSRGFGHESASSVGRHLPSDIESISMHSLMFGA